MGDFRRQWAIFFNKLNLGPVLSTMMLLGLVSCSPFASKKPSVIVVLLESLTEDDYLCSEMRWTENLPALQEECTQFVRFTHTFAPSNLTQPNLASLMTGKEISEHKVRHNGTQGVSAKFQTLAESALNLNMRTGFFSGGVPLLPKFGIRQGFENYRDGFQNREKSVHVPLHENMMRSLEWIDKEVESAPFFLTLYAPDLLYKDTITVDNMDDERPVGRNSNLQEIYESMDFFIGELKKRKLWENSTVIFLGLGGRRISTRPINPLTGLQLHVPLQIKLAKGIESNIKSIVGEMASFAKVGGWIEKIVFHRSFRGSLLFSPSPEENFIPQQNDWRRWLGLSNWSTIGLRRKQYLFVYNPELKVYDSFSDKEELDPLLNSEAQKVAKKYEIPKKMKAFFPSHCMPELGDKDCKKRKTHRKQIEGVTRLVRWSGLVLKSEKPVDELSQWIRDARKEKNKIIINWLAYRALYQKKWGFLHELGQLKKEKTWRYLAAANLREDIPGRPEGCLLYFFEEHKKIDNFYKHCKDSGLRRVVEGLHQLKNKQSPSNGFWAQVNEIKNKRRAKILNLKMLFVNDIAQPFDYSPELSELYFFLPENTSYLKYIQI